MSAEAVELYNQALKAGQRYYKHAVSAGDYPYPLVLDEILNDSSVAGYVEIGLVNIPSELIVGTRSAGRISALAGNFMPLLNTKTEFAAKWISLCGAQVGAEGIRDPVKCYEYMGRFYIEEGNKRVSVMRTLGAPTVPGNVIRVVPRYSDDPAVQLYYEFMSFHALTGLYGVSFRHSGGYTKLLAALGFDEEHVWTEEERRSFLAGFTRFTEAYDKLAAGRDDITSAEALLVWLQVYTFADVKSLPMPELTKNLTAIWPDVAALADPEPIELSTQPEDKSKGFLSKLLSVGRPDHIDVAFIYAFDPETSVWTGAHDLGREYIEQRLGDHIGVRVYHAYDHDYLRAMTAAVDDGARLIFATTPNMIAACRKIAAQYGDRGVKILNCGLSQPYTGVRMYYSRIHECKFVTGAIAGAMTEGDAIGYVANYPIVGAPASINAFALGVRLTNPRARVKLVWSCTEGDPLQELTGQGVTVISNRDAADPQNAHRALEWGIYKLRAPGVLTPLAAPCWHWGRLYERIIQSIFSGAWNDISKSKAINYWWGMDSGVIDVQLSSALPDGVRSLAHILKNGIIDGSVSPFRTRIADQAGTLRNDGLHDLPPEEIMAMDWLCDNVDGALPDFDALLPMSRDTVRMLGLHREELPPEKEEKQL